MLVRIAGEKGGCGEKKKKKGQTGATVMDVKGGKMPVFLLVSSKGSGGGRKASKCLHGEGGVASRKTTSAYAPSLLRTRSQQRREKKLPTNFQTLEEAALKGEEQR